ncbi:ParB/RepB/Spo0J family partition protein [Rubrivivax gelatinosus]|uniref:Putative ParB family protein n=1 Tax=Rubrivivax gelatinosus (strain NBRC 100245 / IL144) TaxID=983917 RepID=I0HTK4_RUBGI|nr:ParB/RepB/Spo0J family partition protein [Rubrivivax gelatinosus]BAL96341.1 putative ParB family protein [Rubrivivax gelatinosus IL144]
MRLRWPRPAEVQLDLLDTPAAPVAPAEPAVPGKGAAGPAFVATDCLVEDPDNPRTELPAAELDELAEDIRRHGVLQPIVVHPADDQGRHKIHFGAKRWRAAQRIGLAQVPVVVRAAPADPYAQVSENQKRHGLTPLDLARFIRGRNEAGDSNTTVAQRLGMDLTTVAHHLALLELPPALDEALQSGRCTSPRTLYELSRLHTQRPEAVAQLLEGSGPVTREAVAQLREVGAAVPSASARLPARPSRSNDGGPLLSRAERLCERLDQALSRLTSGDASTLSPEARGALKRRLGELAARLDDGGASS